MPALTHGPTEKYKLPKTIELCEAASGEFAVDVAITKIVI
jgi:hypothetical protein